MFEVTVFNNSPGVIFSAQNLQSFPIYLKLKFSLVLTLKILVILCFINYLSHLEEASVLSLALCNEALLGIIFWPGSLFRGVFCLTHSPTCLFGKHLVLAPYTVRQLPVKLNMQTQ